MRQFIWSGIKQAGKVFFFSLLITVAVSCVGLQRGNSGWESKVFVVMAAMLTGPGPSLLTLFDISDGMLLGLSAVALVAYWCGLGAVAGLICRRAGALDSQVDLSRRHLKWLNSGIVVAALLLGNVPARMGVIAGLPSFVRVGPSPASGIINNLRLIDGAKQQLALEKKLSVDYVPTEAELAPYFNGVRGPTFHAKGLERYILNRIDVPPMAVLDADWRIRRRGWREGYTISKTNVYRLE